MMIPSKAKKPSSRRLKSSSPKKGKNKFYDYNNKNKEFMLALEESKKLYSKLFSNPSNIVINQLKGEDLKIYIVDSNIETYYELVETFDNSDSISSLLLIQKIY